MPNHVIIGTGAAGLNCAKAIRSRDKSASITLIGREEQYPYDRPGLSALVGSGAGFDSIIMEKPEFYQENGLELLYGTAAVEVDPIGKTIQLSTGEALSYDKLCLATGATPFNPYTQDVYTLRTYEDATAILKNLKGKPVFIVGGGILGLEAAMALTKQGCKVSIADRGPYLLPLQADAYTGEKIKARLESLGISVYLGTSVKTLLKDSVILEDGHQVPCKALLVSIGVRSETSLAKAIGLAMNRGIIINEKCETSQRDIYACGDCAEFNGIAGGQWAIAVEQGETAGAQMAGESAALYQPELPMMVFNAPGLNLFSGGQLSGEDLEHAILEKPGAYAHLTFRDGRVCGTLLLGASQAQGKAIALLNTHALKAQALTLLD